MKILKTAGLILLGLFLLKLFFFGLGLVHLAFFVVKMAVIVAIIALVAKALGLWK